jgi:thiol-activated cytolysin
MKKTSIHLAFIALILISASCKKNKTDNQPDNTKSEPDKINVVNWKFDSFAVNNENVNNIYPGAIFDLKKTDNNFELNSLTGKYTPLNVTASTSLNGPNISHFEDIPSTEKIKNYVQSLSPEKANYSGAFSDDSFKDYNVVKYYLTNNNDVKAVFDQLGLSNTTRITKKSAISLYSLSERFTLDMSLPKKTNFISTTETDKLIKEYNPYYINSVSYGNSHLILVEGDADLVVLKLAIKAFVNHQELSSIQEEALKNAKITFYSRNGSSKSFIKVTNDLASAKQAVADLDAYNKNGVSYPIAYRLRSLKDFSLFKFDVNLNIIN